MKSRITLLIKSKFNKLYIHEIDEDNCEEMSRRLSLSMMKTLTKKNLYLQFFGKLNETMKQMLVHYRKVITSLDIEVRGNDEVLIQHCFIFDGLDSLSLSGYNCNDEVMVGACEAMLNKHAKNLKSLTVGNLNNKLSVPDLSSLSSLSLYDVDEKALWIILSKCRHTITWLELNTLELDLELQANSLVYHIPNLEHLIIKHCNAMAFKFVIFNAEHLICLEELDNNIPLDILWPQLPKLRELSIYGSELLPIFMNCRETLERLIIHDIHSSDDEYCNVIMPCLTDLYVIGSNHEFTNNILSSNKKCLEFLVLWNKDISHVDESIKMEDMKSVMIGNKNCYYSDQDKNRMEVICPNAKIVFLSKENKDEIRHQVQSRCKRKFFSIKTRKHIPI